MRRSKSKTNIHHDSRESLDGGNYSSSNENLSGSREIFYHNNSSLNKFNQFKVEVHSLGMIQDVNLVNGSYAGDDDDSNLRRDPEVQLIDKVEEAQLEGKINMIAREDDIVIMTISKHGIKTLDKNQREVLQRHPLHTVSQIVHYMDSFDKNNIALKIGTVGRQVYTCYVFQCSNEDAANKICQNLKSAFDAISSGGL